CLPNSARSSPCRNSWADAGGAGEAIQPARQPDHGGLALRAVDDAWMPPIEPRQALIPRPHAADQQREQPCDDLVTVGIEEEQCRCVEPERCTRHEPQPAFITAR